MNDIPPYDALRAASYEQSEFSGSGNSCVGVGTAQGWIGIQDTKQYENLPPDQRTTLGFTKDEFEKFLKAAKAGQFDHLI